MGLSSKDGEGMGSVTPLRLGTAPAASCPGCGTHGTPLREMGSGHGSHPTAELRGRRPCSLFLSPWNCVRCCGLCKHREPCVTVLQTAGTAAGVGGRGGPRASVFPGASVHRPGLSFLPTSSLDAFFFLAFRAVGLVVLGLVDVLLLAGARKRLQQVSGLPS